MKKIFSFITIVVSLGSFIPVTLAGFSMIPSGSDTRRQFNFELKTGETKQDSIVIENNNEQPLTLLLYGADATHSNQGSFALVNRTAIQRTIGNWVKFKDSTITLQGGEKKEIPFTITVPDQTTPGNYAGGIAAETTTVQNGSEDQKNSNTGAGVVIASRLVVKLFIAIPGEKNIKYTWNDYSRSLSPNDKERFILTFSNEGNAAIAVEPKINITNLFGGDNDEIKIPDSTLLQGEKITIPIDWDKKPFFGYFTAKATTTFWQYDVINDRNINPDIQTKTVTFWIIPWNIAAIVIAVITLILIIVVSKILLMRKLKKSSRSYEVQEGETLISIAENAEINWKKLAKLNKLKPPYTIKKGDTLQVPIKK